MIKRLGQMEAISDHYERRLWQYYSYRKWRTREPFDDVIPVEQPQNLRGSIELLIENGLISRRELLRQTGLSAEDVRSLTGLPPDFFDTDPPNLVRLKPSVRREGGAESEGGTVVPFGERRK